MQKNNQRTGRTWADFLAEHPKRAMSMFLIFILLIFGFTTIFLYNGGSIKTPEFELKPKADNDTQNLIKKNSVNDNPSTALNQETATSQTKTVMQTASKIAKADSAGASVKTVTIPISNNYSYAAGSIVTTNQSGGINTVNNNVNLPPPEISLTRWEYKNIRTNKIKNIVEESEYKVTQDSFFYNKFYVDYDSQVQRAEIKIVIALTDSILDGQIGPGYGYSRGALYDPVFSKNRKSVLLRLSEPNSGSYSITLCTKERITSLSDVLHLVQ